MFFAFSNWNPKEGNCKIWVLNPNLLNKLHGGQKKIFVPKKGAEYKKYINGANPLRNTIAIEAPDINEKFNARIKAQKGCFTLHYIQNTVYKENYSLENELEATTNIYLDRLEGSKKDILSCIELSSTMYDEVEQYLMRNGVTYKEIYPDVEGLSNYINDFVLLKDYE